MNSLRTAKRFVFPLLGLWVLLYASFSLLKPPLLDGVDSSQAEAAREMATGSGWLVPHLNGEQTLAFSPLLTWTTAISLRIFGTSDWAARLPLALFALALFLLTLSLGSRLFLRPVAGFYAALILLTSAGIFLFAHLLYPQLLSTLWLTAAMYFFWRSLHHQHASLRTALGFAAACGLGVLTQGLAGVVVPLLLVIVYLVSQRNLGHLLRWSPIPAAVLFLAIVLPWPIAIRHLHPLQAVLMPAPYPSPRVFFLLIWAFALLWIAPWCVFSAAEIIQPSRECAPGTLPPPHSFLLQWAIYATLLYTILHPHEFSIMPALPALALLAAGWFACDESCPGGLGRTVAWIFLLCGLPTAVVAAVLALHAPWASSSVDIATLLRLHPGQHTLFFGHLRDLTFASMGAFRIPLLIAAAALAGGTVANLLFRLRSKARMANCFLAGMMVFLLIAAHVALNTFSPVISSAVLAEAIKPELTASDQILINGRYEDASALNFYLERPVRALASGESAASLAATLWSGDARVFLWTRPETLPALPGPVYVIARDGGREIVSNQPDHGGALF
jgi:4-amino-4-deoxy-L-arabinose transferase-like glycosyltransferase